MKKFINYIKAISTDPYLPKKADYTTTIILPELDSTEGIYRSLLPSYVLNLHPEKIRILITGITAKMNISNNDKDLNIDAKLISQTDHFVFPFVSYPLAQIIEKIKKHKPSVKFSYYIDANFYLMPEAYPFGKQYRGTKMIESIESNIEAVDRVIVTSIGLDDYIIAKLKERHPGKKFGTNFYCQPLYILPDLLKTEKARTVDKKITRVLIIGDQYHFSDINYIKGILKEFQAKYKDKTEIHIIGFDGKWKDRNYLSGIDFTYHHRVSYFDYFNLINQINPNVLLIPANKTAFNDTSKNNVKYFEASLMNIPVLAPDIAAYNKLITNNQNGFLCPAKEDYSFQLETMFTEPAKYEGTLGLAYATAIEYSITDNKNIQKLISIYFPDYGEK